MKTQRLLRTVSAGLLVAGLTWLGATLAQAQSLAEQTATMGAMDQLNSSSVGPTGVGVLGIDRAREAAAQSNQGIPGYQPPATAPTGFAPPGGLPGPFGMPMPGAPGSMLPLVAEPRITVLAGTRVFDALTGNLLDDAQEMQVPEADKGTYFDDGTHGDQTAGDGKFSRVDERRDALSQTNQRIKEQMVQALLQAEGMSPLEFFGYTLMSNDRTESISRDRAWKLVPAPGGSPGSMLAEVPIDKPLEVPRYRDQLMVQNKEWIKGNWSDRFLTEFRKNKDSLSSEFFTLHVPAPPVPPGVVPPTGWVPFAGSAQPPAAPQTPVAMPLGGVAPTGGMPGAPAGSPMTGNYYNPANLGN